jgi:pilus assembly protein CpaE
VTTTHPVPSTDIAIPVVVVDADPETCNRIATQLGERAVAVADMENLEARVGPGAMVLVLGPSYAQDAGMLDAGELIQARPEVGALLVADQASPELFQRAIRTGIRDVLSYPADTVQLNDSVRRVAFSLGSFARPAPVDGPAADDGGENGKMITVFSTKGGAGKSIVASNLAVVLAQRSDRPVVLVDADLQFGDIAVMLKLSPRHTVVDAVKAIDGLDVGQLKSLLTTHPSSGLLVLAAPLEPAFADQVRAEQMNRIVALLRTFCAFVVVDTPSYFNDVVLSLIETSDEVLIIAGMDIPNIKNVKIGLQTLRMLNAPMSKIHLVLNRANSKVNLDVAEVERTLQIKAESLIPSDIVVPQSVNKGEPVVTDSPRSGVARSIDALADMFLPVAAKRKWR